MRKSIPVMLGGLLAAVAGLTHCGLPAPEAPYDGTVDPGLRAIAGLEFFSESGCAACHCNDAVGGCNLDAPSLQGATAAKIASMLREEQTVRPHPMKMAPTDAEVADLELFLGSLTPDFRFFTQSQVTLGYGLYVRAGCITCHLASAQGVNQGGIGAAIAGTDPDNIYAALSGAVPCHPLQREVPDAPSSECRYEITTNETVAQLTDRPPPDSDTERVLLSYFLSFISPPPTGGVVEPCERVPGTVCTVAGNGTSGYSRDGVAATESLLFSPIDLALTDWNDDGVLDLVIDDWNNHRIRIVYLDTVIEGVADRIDSIAGTGKVTGSDALNHPTDVAFDAEGGLVMANWHNQCIYRYPRALVDGSDRDQLAGLCDLQCSPASDVPTRVDETVLGLPVSVAIHPDGRIFFTESACSRVRILTVGRTRERTHPPQCTLPVNLYADGMIETLAGKADESGRFGVKGYAGDGGPASEAIFNVDNLPVTPNFGIALSTENPPKRLYVADSLNNCVRYIDLSVEPPTIHLFAGDPTLAGYKDGSTAEALFNFPTNVYAGADGLVYVVDNRNHVIRTVDPETRRVSTLIGTGRRGYNGDNKPALETDLDGPGGLVIHPDGRIFVADLGNNRVRVINP